MLEILKKEKVVNMKQSISTLFELYIARSDLAESSVAIKQRALKCFTKAFGDRSVESIDYATAEDYRTILAKERSKQSANIYLQNFKPFFNWMLKRGYIEENPFAGLSLFVVGEQQRPVYSPEEISRIIMIAGLRWKVAVLLALCSMRRAEVLNLVVQDIDFDNSNVLVSPKKDTANTWRWNIKNHNQTIVPLPEKVELLDGEVNLHNLLLELIAILPANQPYVMLKQSHYQKMMHLKAAGKLNHELRNDPWQGFSRDYRALLRRAQVPHKRYHDLRATFATRVSAHLSLTETQKLMRHSSPNTTAKYYIRHEQRQLVDKTSKIVQKILYGTN